MIEKRLDWLYRLRGKNIKLGLEPTKKLLNAIGLKTLPYPVIHIAGTNGKGTVANLLHLIMLAHGLRSALYTSPHIEHFNERIRTGDEMISDEAIESFLSERQSLIEEIETTFFETTTVMAFHWFAERNVDVAVIETGLGGRFDATNVVDPVCSVITRIDYDHREYLGNTLKEIAFEKLGIVKEGKPLFTIPQDPTLKEVFSEVTERKNAKLNVIKAENIKTDRKGVSFTFDGREWRVSLFGKHQGENAALALAVSAFFLGERFSVKTAEKVLKNVTLPGRIEQISQNPPIFMDSAHNAGGIRALTKTLGEIFPEYNWVGLMAIMGDKEINEILPLLSAFFKKIHAASFDYYRAMPAKKLAELLRAGGIESDIRELGDLSEITSRLPAGTGLVVFGTHYILGESKKILLSRKKNV